MIRKKSFSEDHADVATSYNNLALVYYNLKEYNQAKELHEKALMIICRKNSCWVGIGKQTSCKQSSWGSARKSFFLIL